MYLPPGFCVVEFVLNKQDLLGFKLLVIPVDRIMENTAIICKEAGHDQAFWEQSLKLMMASSSHRSPGSPGAQGAHEVPLSSPVAALAEDPDKKESEAVLPAAPEEQAPAEELPEKKGEGEGEDEDARGKNKAGADGDKEEVEGEGEDDDAKAKSKEHTDGARLVD